VVQLQLEMLCPEQNFDANQIDNSTAVKIGKMLGAKGVQS